MSLLTLKQFYDKTNGKSWANYKGSYKGQCVSLVSQYLNLCFGLKPGAWGNAVDYATKPHAEIKKNFTWMKPGTPAKDGDILVWGDDKGNWTGPYGHIAIWYKGKIYDQNYAGRMTAGLDPFFDNGYLGKWRPKAATPAPKPTPKPVVKPDPTPSPTSTPVEQGGGKPVTEKPDYAEENNKLLKEILVLLNEKLPFLDKIGDLLTKVFK